MKKHFAFLIALVTISNVFATENIDKTLSGEKQKGQLTESLRANGLQFSPNIGQLADSKGNLCPDVLYKGEGARTEIYLRKTGISYVYNNMGEVMHEVDEEVEELIKAGTLTEADEQEKKEELMKVQILKIQRVDMDFANANTNTRTINEEEQKGYNNYYYAHCPKGVLNVKQYHKVIYKNIYNNIDVHYWNPTDGLKIFLKFYLIIKPTGFSNCCLAQWFVQK